MNGLLGPETFEFFARYVLAGFIILSVRSRFVVGEKPKPAEVLLEAVVLSLINQLAFLPLSGFAFWISQSLAANEPGRLMLLLETLVLPALLGLVFGWNLSRGWNRAFLRRLSMPTEHPVRRGYDYAFATDRSPCFVILTFQDNTQVYGYFGPNSLAANDQARSDIYLERLYELDGDGVWAENSVGRSAIISLDGLRSIEFLDAQETGNG